MLVERRRAERDRRESLRVGSVFAVKSRSRGRIQLGQAEDVCPGGITLRRPRDGAYTAGTTLELTFVLPGGGPVIDATAEVVSDRSAGAFRRTGLRFTALAAAHEQFILDYCLERLGRTVAVAVAV
jgi:c-di-GMP-binding flagellar brake protein YcgR